MTMIGMLSSKPQIPQRDTQNSSEMNTAAAFILVFFPVIHVVIRVPRTVAIANDAPATSRAIENEPNCKKAAQGEVTSGTTACP